MGDGDGVLVAMRQRAGGRRGGGQVRVGGQGCLVNTFGAVCGYYCCCLLLVVHA